MLLKRHEDEPTGEGVRGMIPMIITHNKFLD
jgi:hypothetical protein